MTEHGALSILANIIPGKQEYLTNLLKEVDDNREDTDGIIPFPKLTSVHFARFVILNEAVDTKGSTIPSRLAFTTNFDLPLNNHWQELITYAGAGLWKVFSCCVDFRSGDYDPVKLRQYLEQHSIKAKTFYVGVGYRSVQQVRNEKKLREDIENFADANQSSFKGKSNLEIRERIIEHVRSSPDFEWASTPEPGPGFAWKLKHYGALILAICIGVPIVLVLLPLIIIWVLIIFIDEVKTNPAENKIDKQHLRELMEHETGMVQAQFSAVGNMKPGWFRLQTTNILLMLTNFLAPYIFSKGKLSGIPTVHFARWLIINKGKQMLFLSNYDGNSETYLRDFINIAGRQLTLLFSHTIGYPKTWFMVFGGAKDAKKFMEWARHNQTVTNVWYSANKNLTVNNVFNNSKVRDGLYGTLTEEEATKWLSLI
ncbi:MAG TPA: hypothetical protein VFW07_07125 [Parafilimonas sp.]|nr:hypothetical protein [Parafilimonas sp.]